IPEVVKTASENAEKSGGSFTISDSMDEAFRNADIVYPKSWAPWSTMERRTELLKKSDSKGLELLEKESLENNRKYMDWECNSERMKSTKGGEALYMHCLPADISGVSCENGEVDAEVFEKYRKDTYIEAGYKPYIIAAMIMANKFKDPSEVLNGFIKRGADRKVVG
ncbi:MAG: knotted carbamoyltransferase YgeW, partial [Candidatus Aminicenantes bacterium]|nr:knotted carbamoyltransferase YgeW [Candidatus Aminicenantes bacterium]